MKKLFTLFAAALLSLGAMAQTFEEGNSYFHVGIGFGSPYAYSGSKMGIPPIHASFEKAISEKIGVGALVGYTSSSYEYNYVFGGSYKWNYTYLVVGARGAYHFNFDIDKLDPYVGLMLGYNVASAKFESTDPTLEQFLTEPSVGGVIFGGYAGARYDVSDKVTLFGELGYSIAWLSAGICFKF